MSVGLVAYQVECSNQMSFKLFELHSPKFNGIRKLLLSFRLFNEFKRWPTFSSDATATIDRTSLFGLAVYISRVCIHNSEKKILTKFDSICSVCIEKKWRIWSRFAFEITRFFIGINDRTSSFYSKEINNFSHFRHSFNRKSSKDLMKHKISNAFLPSPCRGTNKLCKWLMILRAYRFGSSHIGCGTLIRGTWYNAVNHSQYTFTQSLIVSCSVNGSDRPWHSVFMHQFT